MYNPTAQAYGLASPGSNRIGLYHFPANRDNFTSLPVKPPPKIPEYIQKKVQVFV